MVPTQVLYRVLPLRWTVGGDEFFGTAFSLTHGDEQYLVTAAHVVKEYPHGILTIGRDKSAPKGRVIDPVLRGISQEADIAIFDAPSFMHKKGIPLNVSLANIMLGQEVFWLGYPFGLDGGLTLPDADGPIGLVGSGTLSSMAMPSNQPVPTDAATVGFIVDGLNNEGYSGAPVVFHPDGDMSKGTQVIGVVSGTLAGETNLSLMVIGDLGHALKEILGSGNHQQNLPCLLVLYSRVAL